MESVKTPNPKPARIPRMFHVESRGEARVRLGPKTFYLGPWGSEKAARNYEQLVATWLAQGRVWPQKPVKIVEVTDLIAVYLKHCECKYSKYGRITSGRDNAARALELLTASGLAARRPCDFGPLMLLAFQRWLAADPYHRWSRVTINRYTDQVVAMFKHAEAAELIPRGSQYWMGLKSVEHLRKGRSPAPGMDPPREPRKVPPVADEIIDATIAATQTRHPMLCDMIRLQRLTGMRPGELVSICPTDLSPSTHREVMFYKVTPDRNKCDASDVERTVYLGPKAMAIVRRWADPKDPDATVFSPKRAFGLTLKARAKRRQTPIYGEQSPEKRTKARRASGMGARDDGESYSVVTYGRAVARAAKLAKVDHWHPNQIRHTAASEYANKTKVQVAQHLLGHTKIQTTMGYVVSENSDAIRLVRKIG